MKKKILSAAAAAVLVGFALLFGQAPVQRVRLWDTDLSHSLLFQWNENDVAGRTLNFLVDGASRSLSIFGDTWVEQDYRIAATPTFAGLYLQSSTAAPFLNMTNESATERDPVHRWSVGATPEVKFTHGLDDSDSDSLKWTNVDGLVDTVTGGMGWGTYLIVSDNPNNRIKEHLASDLTYHAQVAATAPGWTCTDGTNYYVTFPAAHLVRKYLVSDNSLLWTIGDIAGNGDDQFNTPCGITTDGIHLYIADKLNTRIKKHLCTTGGYVAKLGTAGTALGQFVTPTGITTDGKYLYITEGSPGAAPLLKKHLCSTLAGVSQISADGHLDATNCQSITTDGNFLWLLNSNNAALNTIFKYSRGLAYISEYGANGAGNTQFDGPVGIATDKTYLYVSDTNNDRIKQHLCSDYSYVAKFGSFGAGDNNFNEPRGISVGFLGEGRTGKLLELWQDGSRIEVYPKIFLYNYLVFLEDSSAASNYIAFRAPTSITVSYDLTLPSASAGAKKHLYVDIYDNLQWGQNVDTDGSPTLVRLTLTQAAGTAPLTVASNTEVTNFNSNYLQGNLATAFGPASAKYITQEADATLTAEQALSVLATGILKNTTGTGVLSIATSGTDYEAGLGNPDADGKVLSSTALGVRSWILPGGALALDDLTDVDAAAPDDDDIIRWDAGGGVWQHEALPAAANHNLLSATHSDTTAAAAVAGDIIYADATPKWVRLPKGDDDDVLMLKAGIPSWEPGGGGGAPADAEYVVETANAGLSAEVVLGTTVITTTTYAARQAAAKAGRLFLPNNSFYLQRDTGAAWTSWGPIWQLTPPIPGDFAWINQGTATSDSTYGGLSILAAANASASIKILKKAAPSTPYIITACFLVHAFSANYNSAGFCFRQSSDGKLVTWGISPSESPFMRINNWTNETTWSSTVATVPEPASSFPALWLRIADDGTNRICSISVDGYYWYAAHSISRTNFLTADEVGFWANSQNATYPVRITLLSWREE